MIHSSEGLFSIHDQTGELTVKKPLDREVKDILKISVLAVDDGEPQRSDQAEVEFVLTDVNDNSPVIRPKKSKASVFEVIKRKLSGYFHTSARSEKLLKKLL